MVNCESVSTPTDLSQKLSASSPGEELTDVPYQEAVGSLLYLVLGTRPVLAFASSIVSRFNSKHGTTH